MTCPLNQPPAYALFEYIEPRTNARGEVWSEGFWRVFADTDKAGAEALTKGKNTFAYETTRAEARALYNAHQRYTDAEVERYRNPPLVPTFAAMAAE